MTKLADLPELASFLASTPVAVMTTIVDAEGTLHAAAMNYWHDPKTLDFYFVTQKLSKKCTLLLDGDSQKAACVVGTENGVLFTVQMRGTAQIVSKEDFEWVIDAYTQKRGDSHGAETDEYVLLQFHPTWATYTDYTAVTEPNDWKPEPLGLV